MSQTKVINETTKSLIRHILTGLGAVVAFLGIGELTDTVSYLSENYETLIASIQIVGGAVMAIIGFFKNKDRHEIIEASKKVKPG